jgi:DNA (cytosine-5)-methyltransferase 1
LRRNPPPSREKRQEVTPFTPSSFGNYGEGVGTIRANGGDLGGGSETLVTFDRQSSGEYGTQDVASTVAARDYKSATDLIAKVYETHPADSRVKEMGDVSQTVTSRWGTGGGHVPLVQAISLQDVSGRDKQQNGKGWNDEGVSYTVDTHATQGVMEAYSLREDAKANNFSATPLHVTPALQALRPSVQSHHAQTFVAQGVDVYNQAIDGDVAATLTKACGGSNTSGPKIMDMAVRRLTPTECERLQGFPDGYTNIPWRGKEESPDGPRYKAMGNSMAVPVMRWIGKRIKEIEA